MCKFIKQRICYNIIARDKNLADQGKDSYSMEARAVGAGGIGNENHDLRKADERKREPQDCG